MKVDGGGSVTNPKEKDFGNWLTLGSYNPYLYDAAAELYSGMAEGEAKSWRYLAIALLALHAPR